MENILSSLKVLIISNWPNFFSMVSVLVQKKSFLSHIIIQTPFKYLFDMLELNERVAGITRH